MFLALVNVCVCVRVCMCVSVCMYVSVCARAYAKLQVLQVTCVIYVPGMPRVLMWRCRENYSDCRPVCNKTAKIKASKIVHADCVRVQGGELHVCV